VGEVAKAAEVAAEVAGMGTEAVRARLALPSLSQFFYSPSKQCPATRL
jgi:hypothetical protein